VRAAFWRAAASSPAALAASLSRYERLLRHADDAARSGHSLDRRLVRAVTNQLDDQLLLWDLIPLEPGDSELALEDLPMLARLRAAALLATHAPDPKLARLGALLADGRCSVVFAAARETVRYLRDRLPDGPIAWCTGERAGIGSQGASRQTVLDWFRPGAVAAIAESVAGLLPRHFLATDVAAEGLDLQRAERVVHYDLPWTPACLHQREGRACRAGASHEEMEAVRFEPPPVVENRLHQLACLVRKRALPTTVGLDDSGRGLWRWRVDVAERFADQPLTFGVAEIRASPAGLLAGFSLYPGTEGGCKPLASSVLWWDQQRAWTEEPGVIESRLAIATQASDGQQIGTRAPSRVTISGAVARLAGPIRERMRQLRGTRWMDRLPSPAARLLIARLQALGRTAARRRDGATLDRVQAALRFAAGSHTAGERILIAQLATASRHELEQAIVRMPPASAPLDALTCRLTGLIVFAP
jgi:hypothetical protein